MLPKKNRITKEKDFQKIFKAGKKYNFPSFKLYIVVKKNNLKEGRFAFIVSKKVSKKAVLRNKIKRRMRSIIQKYILSIKKGFDIIIIALPGIENNNFEDIEKELLFVLKKSKLF